MNLLFSNAPVTTAILLYNFLLAILSRISLDSARAGSVEFKIVYKHI